LGIDAQNFDYLGVSGQSTEQVFKRIFGENSEVRVTEATKKKQSYFRESIQEASPMKGAIELLSYLSLNEKKLYAVSSGSTTSVVATLTATNMIRYFAEIITCDLVKNTKPHPDPYLRAIELSGFRPSECVAIEDSETGVLSALAANLEVILISENSPDWARTYPVQHFESLEPLLRKFQR